MIALLQRISSAAVRVEGEVIARVSSGLLVFLGIERGDSDREAEKLLERVLKYRIFSDARGRMNRALADVGGDLLIVPQFTLAADTRKGLRPSFEPAADPKVGRELFNVFLRQAIRKHPTVASGRFGANMQVELVNDGPVTFWLRVAPQE